MDNTSLELATMHQFLTRSLAMIRAGWLALLVIGDRRGLVAVYRKPVEAVTGASVEAGLVRGLVVRQRRLHLAGAIISHLRV